MRNDLYGLKLGKKTQHLPGCDNATNFISLHDGIKRFLPKIHSDILTQANGVSIFHGFFRLFGTGNDVTPSMEVWNSKQFWKFAWNGMADGFLCFGTTAWGDQYAYQLDSLKRGGDPKVFLLDAITMEAEELSKNFEDFWHNEFLRNSESPYDSLVIKWQKRVNLLDWEELLIFQPPLQLGGHDETAECTKLNMRAAMIANGDLSMQLNKLPEHAQIMSVDSFTDDHGRTRLKLNTHPLNIPLN